MKSEDFGAARGRVSESGSYITVQADNPKTLKP